MSKDTTKPIATDPEKTLKQIIKYATTDAQYALDASNQLLDYAPPLYRVLIAALKHYGEQGLVLSRDAYKRRLSEMQFSSPKAEIAEINLYNSCQVVLPLKPNEARTMLSLEATRLRKQHSDRIIADAIKTYSKNRQTDYDAAVSALIKTIAKVEVSAKSS